MPPLLRLRDDESTTWMQAVGKAGGGVYPQQLERFSVFDDLAVAICRLEGAVFGFIAQSLHIRGIQRNFPGLWLRAGHVRCQQRTTVASGNA